MTWSKHRWILITLLGSAIAMTAMPSPQDQTEAEAAGKSEEKSYPCHASDYRAFDFWIGEWDVLVGDQIVGRNSIAAEHQGCALVERYSTGARGYTGMSLNYRDGETGHWHQLWIDVTGAVTRYEGSFVDGAMRFEGLQTKADGTRQRLRMNFTPRQDGSARQLIETFADDTRSWTVAFDGKYVRRDQQHPSEAGESSR